MARSRKQLNPEFDPHSEVPGTFGRSHAGHFGAPATRLNAAAAVVALKTTRHRILYSSVHIVNCRPTSTLSRARNLLGLVATVTSACTSSSLKVSNQIHTTGWQNPSRTTSILSAQHFHPLSRKEGRSFSPQEHGANPVVEKGVSQSLKLQSRKEFVE
jgi:hypothetical protein